MSRQAQALYLQQDRWLSGYLGQRRTLLSPIRPREAPGTAGRGGILGAELSCSSLPRNGGTPATNFPCIP